MSMKRIVHFEDDAEWRELVREAVEESPHELIAQADSLPSSLTILNQMQSGEIEADTVILGGNLSERGWLAKAAGEDPKIIMEAIAQKGLRVTTIGMAGLAMTEYGVEVDIDVPKVRAAGLLAETLDFLQVVDPDF